MSGSRPAPAPTRVPVVDPLRTAALEVVSSVLPAVRRMWAWLPLLDKPLGRLHHANIVHVGGGTGDIIFRPPSTARLQSRIQQVLLEGRGQEVGGRYRSEVRLLVLTAFWCFDITFQFYSLSKSFPKPLALKSPERYYSFGMALRRVTV